MAITPTITFVEPTTSKSGKSFKVLLAHPDFEPNTTHFAYIPVEMTPEKWNKVQATTVKFGDREVDYLDPETNQRITLKSPRKQVSFFGDVKVIDGEELPETKWTDARTKRVESPTENGTKRSF